MGAEGVAAFLLGLEGLALLRGAVEGNDSDFVAARIAEIGRIIKSLDAPPFDTSLAVSPIDAELGYSLWAPNYDGPNPLIDVEEPTVRRLIDRSPGGRALDAACGTGRHAQYLVSRGHAVVGIDSCEAMLEIAKAKVPAGDFRLGDLRSLPLEEDSVDLVVCGLALPHLPSLREPFAEFARVLQPGGRLVTSDIHHLSLYLGGVPHVPDGRGGLGRLPVNQFLPSDYVRAALHAGFVVGDCEEVLWPDIDGGHGGPTAQAWCPEAARAVYVGFPAVIAWDFALPS